MFIRGFTPESVLGYLIVPSNVLRNGEVGAGRRGFLKKTMLPAGFVAQRTILSTELPCGGTARPFASTLISDQWRHGPSALKHNVFEWLAPREAIQIGGNHTPTPVGCRFA